MRPGTSISVATRKRTLGRTRKSSMSLRSSKNPGVSGQKAGEPETFEYPKRQRKSQLEIIDGQDCQAARRDTETREMRKENRKIARSSKNPGVTGRKSGQPETFESLRRRREDQLQIIAGQDIQIARRDTTIRDMRMENKMLMDEVSRLTKELELADPSPEQPERNVFSYFSARRSNSPDDNDGDSHESPGMADLLKEWS